MKNKSARYSGWRLGSIMALTAGLAFFMVGMTALVTDVGYLYYNQARLQTAVNAGWKAGYDIMMQKSPNQSPPSAEVQALVRAHVAEVMKANGYTDAELATVQVEFGPNNHLKVFSRQEVGLFFARVLNFTFSNVTAERQNHALDVGQGIVPLAIPHGVIKDMARNTFGGHLFGEGEGFIPGSAYILKLGSGGGSSDIKVANIKEKIGDQMDLEGDESDPLKMLFIPMDAAQTQPLRAYGAVFWCLRTDNSDPGLYVPVLWMVGYRGGSFLTPYNLDIITKLNEYAVYFEEITGDENIQVLLDQANPHIEELFSRPRIGVYSNATAPAIGALLAEAKIPYGNYSLAGNWPRASIYNPANNTLTNDNGVLAGAVDSFQAVFTGSGEDLTGFCNGCIHYSKTCEDYIRELRYGATNTDPARDEAESYMCSYCAQYYDSDYRFDFGAAKDMDKYATDKDRVWSELKIVDGRAFYISRYNDVLANCRHKNRRCVDRSNSSNAFYYNLANPNRTAGLGLLCGNTTALCGSYLGLYTKAVAAGFSADAGSAPKPQAPIDPTGVNPSIAPDAAGWFDAANPVQKMKWAIAERLRQHVNLGGHLFAQDFTAESLELALVQSSLNQGNAIDVAGEHSLGFSNFTYKLFPAIANSYSSINKTVNTVSQAFQLLNNLDLRSQNSGSDPDTNTGVTNAFNFENMKAFVTSLGHLNSSASHIKYLTGKLNIGEFTFLGGANYVNLQSKRLILNNVLYASYSNKDIAGGNILPLAGKQKANYGPIDPDNVTGGGANDYRDRFMFGFNAPIEINDRIVTETGNMVGPTDEALEFRLNGTEEYPPNKRIIVPITDIPPEVLAEQPGASTVYDVQGKDQPNGAYTVEEYNFSSSIRVIGFAEFEIIAEDDPRARTGEEYLSGDAGDLGPYQPGQVRAVFIRYVIKPGDIPLI